jgi:type IV pilus assembly protein PilY1
MLENSGTQNYVQFVAAEQTRLNVVYGGANDGFLHGFRAGSFDGGANFVDNSTTPNDGQEVLAYMPGSILQSAASPSTANGCTISNATGSVVQNIHGLSPAVAANPPTIPAALAQCVDPALDYSNTQYGHNFFVDATPGTGDLFYGGVWHTWLVGGLGMGGNAIYALDITDPLAANTLFQETNASRIVIGEWNSATITCAGNTTCGNSLGNTFGVPQIRRLHNGDWGVIFGNGFNSTNGDAGIFVMTVDNSAAATKTFYYISAPGGAGGNGIAFATPADLDGDHITDYVYAGDLKGNVWRFDLTSSDPTQWSAASAPMFTTSSGQPITSQLLVISTAVTGSQPRLLIEFGTGQRTQLSNTAPVSFAGGGQALYGIWDWNLSAWNTLAPGSKYASLAASTTATGLASPFTMQPANLQQQALTINAQGVRDQATTVAVCWQGSTTCTSGNTQFGWFATLPGGSEQIIFNPVFFQGAFIVDSTVPATNIPTSCTTNSDSGFTYVLSVANGGVFTNAFPTYRDKNGVLITDSIEAGVQTNATGSVYVVTTPQGTSNIIFQTVSGTPGSQQVNIPSNTKAKRLTWIERR